MDIIDSEQVELDKVLVGMGLLLISALMIFGHYTGVAIMSIVGLTSVLGLIYTTTPRTV